MRIEDLRNPDQRKQFLDNYPEWDYIGEFQIGGKPMYRYYRYADGICQIYAEERYIERVVLPEDGTIPLHYTTEPRWGIANYYLVVDGYSTFLDCRLCKTELIRYMKERAAT